MTSNMDEPLRSAEFIQKDLQIHKTDRTKKEGVFDYRHTVYHTENFVNPDLNKSAYKRLCKIFGYARYALEAFECGHHVFYASDDMEERKNISDYVRQKTLPEIKTKPRVFIITRNEYIARERFYELVILVSGVYQIPVDATAESLSTHRCLISTIEAFRNFYLQYPGQIRSHDVLIFEDFQYFNDPNVGHFYEETLLSPPLLSQCVFLSSRMENADELSKWLFKSENHNTLECITVFKRNFTLNHSITRQYEGTIGQVVDENGEFKEARFLAATKIANERMKTGAKSPQIVDLVRTVLFRVPNPILIYSFDTEDIDDTVKLLNRISLHSEDIQLKIEKMFNREVAELPKDVAEMTEVQSLLSFLQRGIAPYHYGMFPFLRKFIKFLFSKDLIKILVADNSVIKETNFQFHGAIILRDRYMIEVGHYRWIKPIEYKEICERMYGKTITKHQTPLVILVNGVEDMSINVARDIFTNNIPSFESQIKINPTLLLSSIRSPILYEDDAITKSFERYKRIEHERRTKNELREKARQLQDFDLDEESYLQRYQKELDVITELKDELRKLKFIPLRIKDFIDVGRIVKIRKNNRDFGYSVIVWRSKTKDLIHAILNVTKESYEAEDDEVLRPAEEGLKNKMVIYQGSLMDVYVVTQERLAIPGALRSDEECTTILRLLNKTVSNYMGDIPELELEHLKITDPDIRKKHQKLLLKEKELKNLKDRITNFNTNYQRYQEKMKLEEIVNNLDESYELAQCEDLYEQQRNLFAMLGPYALYDDNRNGLTEKGNFAVDLPSKENILLTELFFNGFFNTKSINETLLILSTFIEMEITLENCDLHGENKKLFDGFVDVNVQKFGQDLRKSKVITPAQVTKYMKSFNATLFDFLILWCKKLPFIYSSRKSEDDIREGFMVVYLQRLYELLNRIIAKTHLIPPHPDEEIKWKDRLKELKTLISWDNSFINIY